MFTVMRTRRPQFTYTPPSEALAIGRRVRRNCTAIGSPVPTVAWYHDGHPIRNSSVVRVNGAALQIESFDQSHQGVYQCVAENEAGEAVSALALTLATETSLRPLRNVTCYPFNATAYLIGFESASKIDGVIVYQANEHDFATNTSVRNVPPLMVYDKFAFQSSWPPYRAFGLILRGMQVSGFRMSNSQQTEMYDLSPLSTEVKCAMQGGRFIQKHTNRNSAIDSKYNFTISVKLNAIVRSGHGVYVWWSNDKLPQVPNLRVQIRTQAGEVRDSLSSLNGTMGVWHAARENVLWEDIDRTLVLFTANMTKDADVTELRVPGNVSGLLLSDSQQQEIRILVPIMQSGQEVSFNYSFVEWTTVSGYQCSQNSLS